MEFLDKSSRELYEEAIGYITDGLNSLYTMGWETVPWLQPLILVIAGCLAFYLAGVLAIALFRLLGYIWFKMGQASHWLSGTEMPDRSTPKLIHVHEYDRWRVQGYEPDTKRDAKRRRDWKKKQKQLTQKEIREIEEQNRSKL